MMLQGSIWVISLVLSSVLRVSAAMDAGLVPEELCFKHVANSQLYIQGREAQMRRKCVQDTTSQSIACRTACHHTENWLDIYAVLDPNCIDINYITLNPLQNNNGGEVVNNTRSITGITVPVSVPVLVPVPVRPFTSSWLRKFCPNAMMFFAEFNVEIQPVPNCSSGEMTSFYFNASFYDNTMEPATCGDNHVYFFTPLPLTW